MSRTGGIGRAPGESWWGERLRRLLARRNATTLQMRARHAPDLSLVRETRGLTELLMEDAAALQLIAAVRTAHPLGGAMAEAGVYRGGSARLICAAKGEAPLHLFDVFETLQGEARPMSAAADTVRGHFKTTHASSAEVRALLAGHPDVHLHPGLVEEQTAAVSALRFGLVHLDLDLPDSTAAALDFFTPRLLPGGIIVADDYDDPGVRGVFQAHFAGRPFTILASTWNQALVIKRGE